MYRTRAHRWLSHWQWADRPERVYIQLSTLLSVFNLQPVGPGFERPGHLLARLASKVTIYVQVVAVCAFTTQCVQSSTLALQAEVTEVQTLRG